MQVGKELYIVVHDKDLELQSQDFVRNVISHYLSTSPIALSRRKSDAPTLRTTHYARADGESVDGEPKLGAISKHFGDCG